MTNEDDLRRLSDLPGNIYLGVTLGVYFTTWYEGRLQQDNDGSWIFRSTSSDGTIVAFYLGTSSNFVRQSNDLREGIIMRNDLVSADSGTIGAAYLRQQLPQYMTN